MNCKCVSDAEEELKEFLSKEVESIHSVQCANVGFRLGKELEMILSIPFNVKADHPGFRSQKGKSIPVKANYCPFCGVKTKRDAS